MGTKSPHTVLPKVINVEGTGNASNQFNGEYLHWVTITERKYLQLPLWLRFCVNVSYGRNPTHLRVRIDAKDELQAYTRFNHIWSALQAIALREEG